MFTSVLALIVATMASATEGSTPSTQPATTPPAAQTASTTPVADPNDKVICKKIVATGSRLGKQKICMTLGQWNGVSRDSKDALDNIQQKSLASGDPRGG